MRKYREEQRLIEIEKKQKQADEIGVYDNTDQKNSRVDQEYSQSELGSKIDASGRVMSPDYNQGTPKVQWDPSTTDQQRRDKSEVPFIDAIQENQQDEDREENVR